MSAFMKPLSHSRSANTNSGRRWLSMNLLTDDAFSSDSGGMNLGRTLKYAGTIAEVSFWSTCATTVEGKP